MKCNRQRPVEKTTSNQNAQNKCRSCDAKTWYINNTTALRIRAEDRAEKLSETKEQDICCESSPSKTVREEATPLKLTYMAA